MCHLQCSHAGNRATATCAPWKEKSCETLPELGSGLVAAREGPPEPRYGPAVTQQAQTLTLAAQDCALKRKVSEFQAHRAVVQLVDLKYKIVNMQLLCASSVRQTKLHAASNDTSNQNAQAASILEDLTRQPSPRVKFGCLQMAQVIDSLYRSRLCSSPCLQQHIEAWRWPSFAVSACWQRMHEVKRRLSFANRWLFQVQTKINAIQKGQAAAKADRTSSHCSRARPPTAKIHNRHTCVRRAYRRRQVELRRMPRAAEEPAQAGRRVMTSSWLSDEPWSLR